MADGMINAAAAYANKLVEDNLKKYLAGKNAEGDNAVNAIIQALQGGQGAAQKGADGQVVGFDWSKMQLPKGLSESESIAALQAALGSAMLQAQQADSSAAVSKLEGLLNTIKSSPELDTYRKAAQAALATDIPSKKSYRQTADPINAWADREITKNAQAAERSGKAGSDEAKAGTTQINMLRGSKLADALLKSEQQYKADTMADALRKASIAKDLFNTSTSPEESLQKAIASLFAGRQYVTPSINWSSNS